MRYTDSFFMFINGECIKFLTKDSLSFSNILQLNERDCITVGEPSVGPKAHNMLHLHTHSHQAEYESSLLKSLSLMSLSRLLLIVQDFRKNS
jgi:hypothetical protein